MAYEAPGKEGRRRGAAFGATGGALESISGNTKVFAAALAATPVPGARIAAGLALVGGALKGGLEGYQAEEGKRLAEITKRAAKDDKEALKASKPTATKRIGREQKPIAPSDDQVLTDSFGGGTAYDRHQKQTFG